MVLYRQSDVPEICELAQILAAVTPKGLMNRAHAYKAAVADNQGSGLDPDVGVNMGLYTYPLLMAADVLGPAADLVPVGSDQQQHLEMTRHIAAAFNARYRPILRVPEPYMNARTTTVRGIDGRKMSKSHRNTIPILAPASAVRAAVMGIVTDSRPVDEPKDPDGNLLFELYALVADTGDTAALADRYRQGGVRYVEVKRELADMLIAQFHQPRLTYDELRQDPAEVERVLRQGASQVRALTAETLAVVRAEVGIMPAVASPIRR